MRPIAAIPHVRRCARQRGCQPAVSSSPISVDGTQLCRQLLTSMARDDRLGSSHREHYNSMVRKAHAHHPLSPSLLSSSCVEDNLASLGSLASSEDPCPR